MSVKRSRLGYLSGLVLSLITGCSSTTPKQLQLSYPNDPEPNEGSVRIATGTSMAVVASVQNAQKRYTVELTEVSSLDEQVAAASLVNGDVLVEAKAAGKSTILIKGGISPGDQAAQRSLEVEVVETASLKLEHHCGVKTASPLYLVGQRLHVGLARYDAQGHKLQGVGPAPVTLSSGAKVDPFNGLQSGIEFDAGDVAGDLVVRSTIDDASLTLKLVSPSQIDGALLSELHELQVGDKESFYVLPSINGQPICQSKLELKAESLSAQICSVTLESDALGDLGGEAGLVLIEALGVGSCRVKTLITIPGVELPVEAIHEVVVKEGLVVAQ